MIDTVPTPEVHQIKVVKQNVNINSPISHDVISTGIDSYYEVADLPLRE